MNKVRKGIFETNSSSTHSVVICDSVDFEKPLIGDEPVSLCQGEFGWEEETYTDFNSKLTYAYTYAKNYGRSTDVDTLKEVIKEFMGLECVEEEGDGYIDHQSIDEAQKIFETQESLKKFLFAPGSHVITDNDNH